MIKAIKIVRVIIYISFINICFTQHIVGQNVVRLANTPQVLFLEIENPVNIPLCNVLDTLDLVINTDNGVLNKESCSRYKISPSRIGILNLIVLEKSKIIDTVSYEVVNIPNPKVRALNYHSISGKTSVKNISGICSIIDDYGLNVYLDIINFDVALYRNGDLMYKDSCNGNRIDSQLRDLLSKAISGDVIVFEKVKVFLPNDSIIEVKSEPYKEP